MRVIEIKDIFVFVCLFCGMIYQEEVVIGEIENQFFLVDVKKLLEIFIY